MQRGTPEVRLWSAVVITLINDCRDDLATTTSIENIGRAAKKWRGRANEVSFRYILDICDIPPYKLQKWISHFERRAKRAFRRGSDSLRFESLADDAAVVGRGQKRPY